VCRCWISKLIIHILSCSFVIMGFYKKYVVYYKSICPRQNISVNVFSYIIGAVTKACSIITVALTYLILCCWWTIICWATCQYYSCLPVKSCIEYIFLIRADKFLKFWTYWPCVDCKHNWASLGKCFESGVIWERAAMFSIMLVMLVTLCIYDFINGILIL